MLALIFFLIPCPISSHGMVEGGLGEPGHCALPNLITIELALS